MNEITQETINKAYKPFDIVQHDNGDVGFIKEVSVNSCQEGFEDQISYHVEWFCNSSLHNAWFNHNEIKAFQNLFVLIAEGLCNPFGNNEEWVKKLIKS